VSTNDIWAAGVTAGDQLLTMHWNGHAWVTQSAPGTGGAVSIVGRGATNAWLLNGELSHWNGAAWTSTTLPANEINLNSGMALDGQGGVWMQLWLAPAPTAGIFGSVLAHYRDGRWGHQPVPMLNRHDPFLLAHMTTVPASTTLWAVGFALTSNTMSSAVILKYGR